MMRFLRTIGQRWSNWIGDSELERCLRTYLQQNGYGANAEFQQLKLEAIQRPGWLQIFSFVVVAVPHREDESDVTSRASVQLYGLVRQDERYERCEIELFETPSQRNEALDTWSQDMLRPRRRRAI